MTKTNWNGQRITEYDEKYIEWFRQRTLTGSAAGAFHWSFDKEINQVDNIKDYPAEWQEAYLEYFIPYGNCELDTMMEVAPWLSLHMSNAKTFVTCNSDKNKLYLQVAERQDEFRFQMCFTITDWRFTVCSDYNEIEFLFDCEELKGDRLILLYETPVEFCEYAKGKMAE